MKCPNKRCGRETGRILFTVRTNLNTGKSKDVKGCPACFEQLKANALYTGRKIWLGTEAYGEDGVREKNHQYGERLKASAERNRRDVSYVSPEAFEVMTGKRPAKGQFQ
jgi:hypothetical protein